MERMLIPVLRDFRFKKPTAEDGDVLCLAADGAMYVCPWEQAACNWIPVSELTSQTLPGEIPAGWRPLDTTTGAVRVDAKWWYWVTAEWLTTSLKPDQEWDKSLYYIVPCDPPKPDYAELQAACGIAVGDFVKLQEKTEPEGWTAGGSSRIDSRVGGVFEVVKMDRRRGILISDCAGSEWVPYTSVKKVRQEYRPFADDVEYAPHFRRAVLRSYADRDDIKGAFYVRAYDEAGVWTSTDKYYTYGEMLNDKRKFADDGTLFGVASKYVEI